MSTVERASLQTHAVMDRVYREHYAAACSVVRSRFKDVDADDVVSQALLAMVEKGRMCEYTPGAGATLIELSLQRALNAVRTEARKRNATTVLAARGEGASTDLDLRPNDRLELSLADAQVHELLLNLTGAQLTFAYCTLVLEYKRSQVMEATGWSEDAFARYKKSTQNRLAELIEQRVSGVTCKRQRALMDWALEGHLSALQLKRMQLHTTHCGACRATLAALRDQRRALGVFAPWLPAGVGVAQAGGLGGLLQGLVGGGSGGAAGAGVATIGGGKTIAVVCGIGCVVGGAVAVEESISPKANQPATTIEAAAPTRGSTAPASVVLRPVSLSGQSLTLPAPAPAVTSLPAARPATTPRRTRAAVKKKRRRASLRSASSGSGGRRASSAQVEKNFGPGGSGSGSAVVAAPPPPPPAASGAQVEQNFGLGGGSASPPPAPAPAPAPKPVVRAPTCYPGDIGC